MDHTGLHGLDGLPGIQALGRLSTAAPRSRSGKWLSAAHSLRSRGPTDYPRNPFARPRSGPGASSPPAGRSALGRLKPVRVCPSIGSPRLCPVSRGRLTVGRAGRPPNPAGALRAWALRDARFPILGPRTSCRLRPPGHGPGSRPGQGPGPGLRPTEPAWWPGLGGSCRTARTVKNLKFTVMR